MSDISWQKVWKRRLWQVAHQKVASSVSKVTSKVTNYVGDFQKRKKLTIPKVFAKITFFLFLAVVLSSFFAAIALVMVAKDLPRPERIVRKAGFSTKIFDRNGKLIYDVYENQKRTPVQLYEVPKYLQQATVAIEDKDFYKHQGFDPKGYLRIIYYLVFHHRLIGSSTLTQQLVKNVLLSSERTISRKVKEFILALEIESRYSKDQILQMYLNEAPYGGTAWGVAEAANTYFGKNVSELNLNESAILAGLPQIPSVYSPFGNTPTAYLGRTQAVLGRMKEDEYISQDEEKKALSELKDVKFSTKSGTLRAPHFVMFVKQILEQKYGKDAVELGGLRVTTSLDLDFQEKAQKIVSDEIAKVEKVHITNGAAIVIDPQNGEILAMVGSKNYDDPNYDGKVNVTLSKRQPGSTIKPVTYVTGLKKGFTASTMLMDVKTTFPGSLDKPEYIPVNYDGKEHGPLQLRFALGNSINIIAVKLISLVGIKDMLTTAYDMGLTTLEPNSDNLRRFGLSLTLGGGEVKLIDLASSYSSFANGGYKVDPVAILKVTDISGNVLEEYKPVLGKQVLSPPEAFIISNILSDNNARSMTFGENSSLKISDRQMAVKTGTTNDRRDNWTIGWTPQVITGVWVGNNDNSQMAQLVSGVSGAAPIWRKIILEYLKDKPIENFKVPENIVQVDVDTVSGYKSHDGFPFRSEYFIKGTEPVADDPVHQMAKLCKGQNKLATAVDTASGNFDQKEFYFFREADPFMKADEENKWQKGINDWIAKQSDQKYHPPTEFCTNSNQIFIKFISPSDQSQVGSDFKINLETVSTEDIVKIELYVNNELKKTITSTPYETDLSLTKDGTYTLKAVAQDTKGNQGTQEVKIGVNVPWDFVPSPTPTPIIPTPTLTLTPTLTPPTPTP